MIKIVGIRFRNAGKIYYFDPLDFEMEVGSHAIVETARGVEYGTVLVAPREVADDQVVQPLKPVIRVATPEDDETVERNKEKEKAAYKICQEKIMKHELEMKLVQAEYTFDNNKLLFYFTADGRIDFRELVKDLASVFRTRIELRQIGVRDETKMLGGMGICGRELCCCSYLTDFVSVSIKMAKEQNLSLNPTKISGVCGRLMCCLKNEEETYEYLNSRLPGVGDIVTTASGSKGEVQSVNVLRQKVKVLIEQDDEKELREYEVDELKFKPRKRNNKFADQLSDQELKELESLEDAEEIAQETKEEQPREQHEKRNHRNDKHDKNDRTEKTEKNDKNDRRDQKDQKYENDRSGRKNNHVEKDSHNHKDNRRDYKNDHKDRGERGDRYDRGDRKDRSGHRDYHRDRDRDKNKKTGEGTGADKQES